MGQELSNHSAVFSLTKVLMKTLIVKIQLNILLEPSLPDQTFQWPGLNQVKISDSDNHDLDQNYLMSKVFCDHGFGVELDSDNPWNRPSFNSWNFLWPKTVLV